VPTWPNPGVVDEDVNRSDLVGHARAIRLVCDVQRDEASTWRLRAARLRNPLAVVSVDVRDDDGGSCA
jgi:hypothetical protein